MTTPMTFHDWLSYGHSNGWCTAPICSTHDGIPMTILEEQEWDMGGDPCVHVVRLCTGNELHHVEQRGGPAAWRASNAGLTD